MTARSHITENTKKQPVSTAPAQGMFQSRPFVVQPQTEEQSQQPDLKTELQRVERYGHRLDRIASIKPPVPTQIPQIVQAKLTIGQPGDRYEQEADRVAAQVVNSFHAPTAQQSQPSQAVQRQEEPEEELQAKPEITAVQRQEEPEEELQTKPSISNLGRSPLPTQVQREAMPEEEELQTKSILQRREAIGGGEASTDVESAINSARGGGQPLEAGLQRSMGQAMGADFSRVKIHADAQADRLNRSIQARAFTTGQDVFFRQGEYNPGSRGGQDLLAHELTHVVQQNGEAVTQNIQSTQQKQQVPDVDKPTSNHRETGIIQRVAATPSAKAASDQAVQNIDSSIGGSQLLSGWGKWKAGRAGHNFTKAERDAVNALGDQYGCCICQTKDPGTKPQQGRPMVNGKQVGNFIPDHEPPNSLVSGGYTGAIRFYPHCLTHSNMQAAVVARYKKEMKTIRSANDNDWATGVQGQWFWNQ